MAAEIIPAAHGIEPQTFDILSVVRRILPMGHIIHGYSASSNERVFRILGTRQYSDEEPILGYGADGNAERALGRSLLSYALREQQGSEHLDAEHIRLASLGQIAAGRNNSRFDAIVWNGDIKLYQDVESAVAASSFGGGNGLEPLEARAPDIADAITLLAERYHYGAPHTALRPAVSLE